MSNIVFFHGDKGGVGKSFACSVYLDYLISQGKTPMIIEADPRNPDVYRLFKNHSKTDIGRLDLNRHEGWMDIVDALTALDGDSDVVINLPAGIGGVINREIPLLAEAFPHINRPIWVVWSLNRLMDSVNLLKAAMKDFSAIPDVHWITIKNGFFGNADQFYRWDVSQLKKDFLKAGHREAFLPELHERVVDVVFPAEGAPVPFSVALREANLKISVRIELERWLVTAHKIFSGIQ